MVLITDIKADLFHRVCELESGLIMALGLAIDFTAIQIGPFRFDTIHCDSFRFDLPRAEFRMEMEINMIEPRAGFLQLQMAIFVLMASNIRHFHRKERPGSGS